MDRTGGTDKYTLDCSEVPKRRQSEDIAHRMSRLSSKSSKSSKKYPDKTQPTGPPRRRQCSEIAKLKSLLDEKLHPAHFTQEVHLNPSDPGYGKPQEGTETAERGKKAHEEISSEIVEMCEVVWEHGHMTGRDRNNNKHGYISTLHQGTLMGTLHASFSRTCSAFTIGFQEM